MTSSDSSTQIIAFKSYVTLISDVRLKYETKLKAVQELSTNAAVIIRSKELLDHSIKNFISILDSGKPQFISEVDVHQFRNIILEIIYRLSLNCNLQAYANELYNLMSKLIEIENEVNILVCLRILIELHKQCKNTSNFEVQPFLQYAKKLYTELPNNVLKMFEKRNSGNMKNATDPSVEELLKEIFIITAIQINKKPPTTYNLIPKGDQSLKVLQEIPANIKHLYHIYKSDTTKCNIYTELLDFIPLLTVTITLKPIVQSGQSLCIQKDLLVEFVCVQIRALTFLIFIIKENPSVVSRYNTVIIKGILNLLTLCPSEITHMKKELLIAVRYLLSTHLRTDFIVHLGKLLEEDILIGNGWTTHTTLRPLAYSTLADLIHHERDKLIIKDMEKAIYLFSKSMLDDSLSVAVQTMSCKLLLSLVELIRVKANIENEHHYREFLLKILEVFILKFKYFSKFQLPILMNKAKNDAQPNQLSNAKEKTESKLKIFGSVEYNMSYSIVDYKILIKTMISGLKIIISALKKLEELTKIPSTESVMLIRLVKWSFRAFDVFMIHLASSNGNFMLQKSQALMSKDEKEVLEHFTAFFSMLKPSLFQEILLATMSFTIERFHQNNNLQLISNSLLTNSMTSPIFATVLVEHLLKKIHEMGMNVELSNLYLMLFKLVFGSVSLFPSENEHVLKQYLHDIVNRSMDLATTAEEPYNYFLLMRALFRSIGGGTHDLLYQEFLPLLPKLLEKLHKLQSGFHKQQLKELFVELCLTIPVRLSSLLPYIPMLMNPLITALNGSQVLVNQGLRTLELCVDNLQPDFLYEHVQPVCVDLMQALWKIMRDPTAHTAQVAFRILGKFGGSNRKVMIEGQKLKYRDKQETGPTVVVYLQEAEKQFDLPIKNIVQAAADGFKVENADAFYRKQCWEVIRSYFAVSMKLEDSDGDLIHALFSHPAFQKDELQSQLMSASTNSTDDVARNLQVTALTSLFYALNCEELKSEALPIVIGIVRHYILMSVAEEVGPLVAVIEGSQNVKMQSARTIIDAIAIIMGNEEQHLRNAGLLALHLVLETVTLVVGSKARACQLQIMQVLSEKMIALCYERAWYSKLGGCMAIQFLIENMDLKWVFPHLLSYVKSMSFIMIDSTDEVSNGVINTAKANLERIFRLFFHQDIQEEKMDLMQVRNEALFEVVNELVCQLTASHSLIREQSMTFLHLIAELQNKPISEVLEPHQEFLKKIVPLKSNLRSSTADEQIGLIDGVYFCIKFTPQYFALDLSITEHNELFQELIGICEAKDEHLMKLPCYKSISSIVPLRKVVWKVLSTCHSMKQQQEKIFTILYESMGRENAELQEAAFHCMQEFISGYAIDAEFVHNIMRPMLLTLGDYRNLNVSSVKRLCYLTQLFPSMFSITLCEQLLQHLRKLFESLVQVQSNLKKTNETIPMITTIIEIFHFIPAATSKFIDNLCRLILSTESLLSVVIFDSLRLPLMRFLVQYPTETLSLLLQDNLIKEQHWSEYLCYILKHEEGKLFREILQKNISRIITMLLIHAQIRPTLSNEDKNEIRYQAVKIVSILMKHDKQVLMKVQLITALKQIWCNDEYHANIANLFGISISQWKESRLIAEILLEYVKLQPDDITLLFQLLRITCNKTISNLSFLYDFLHYMARESNVKWKRKCFFRFVDFFAANVASQKLIANIIQLIIIPCFSVSFERNEDTQLILGKLHINDESAEDQNGNLISVLINKVLQGTNISKVSGHMNISILQLTSLLVEKASQHISNVTQNAQEFPVRKLVTFAWPCLTNKSIIDPITCYHGHLLVCHAIAKFAINKKIIIQVFHNLLKANNSESRDIVMQALNILLPALAARPSDGHLIILQWTKKIIIEECYSLSQLFHILQIIVNHQQIYYQVRHNLMQYMINSLQKLGFGIGVIVEHKKLALELAGTIIHWEIRRFEESAKEKDKEPEKLEEQSRPTSVTNQNVNENPIPVITTKTELKPLKPIDKIYMDILLNFILRLACQLNEVNTSQGISGDQLSRRCFNLLKLAMDGRLMQTCFDIKKKSVTFLGDLLSSCKTPEANYGNICMGLEVITFLFSKMTKEQILQLPEFVHLQKGITICILSMNVKITKLLNELLRFIITTFPMTELSSGSSQFKELDFLYTTINKIISNNLLACIDNPAKHSNSYLKTLTVLKTTCHNNPSYIDHLMPNFMKALHRIVNEHLNSTMTKGSQDIIDIIQVSLNLVKTRIGVMDVEMRRSFIGEILVSLIEKSQDVSVVSSVITILGEWVKNKDATLESQIPNLREKSILLVKMMQFIEKRFPENVQLTEQFLDLVYYIYTDETYKHLELVSKLQPAFLSGLRCTQSHIRTKFFDVFHSSIPKLLQNRLFYIICIQNWEAIGTHYWIKQCIELLLMIADETKFVQITDGGTCLSSFKDLMHSLGADKNDNLLQSSMVTDCNLSEVQSKQPNWDLSNINAIKEYFCENQTSLLDLTAKQSQFVKKMKNVPLKQFLQAVSQLCHIDANLAEQVWLDLFVRLWDIFDEYEHNTLICEMVPFVCSGAHVIQKDSQPNAIATFVEALSRCDPPIPIRPALMKYLGKSHNLYHRMSLNLEKMMLESVSPEELQMASDEVNDRPHAEIFDSLSDMYSLLCEEDMWSGLWQQYAYYNETKQAIALEQQGLFDKAQESYSIAINKYKEDFMTKPAPFHVQKESVLWEKQWENCAKELGQWESLIELGSSSALKDPFLTLESAWRIPDWDLVKKALTKIEFNYPKEMAWKVNLYRGFYAIFHTSPEQYTNSVERYIEITSSFCLREWRRLPHIVSHIHIPLLQATQQITELQEAAHIHQILSQGHKTGVQDMNAIIRTWRNRLPIIADNLSHWSEILSWRQHQFAFISNYCKLISTSEQKETLSMLGIHASAQSIIQFGKVARKYHQFDLCLDSLSKIYSIPKVPITQCFEKIRQQVKCCLQKAALGDAEQLQKGHEVVQFTNIEFFTKEMTAEFFALKGILLTYLGESNEANNSFSAAVQLHDDSVTAWALWGRYLETLFMQADSNKQVAIAMSAITCFLYACKHQNESKARKYIAKILWLINYDDEKMSLLETIQNHISGVPAVHWLPWIPQLLSALIRHEGQVIMNILMQMGKVYPQAMYFSIRTLYLTLKIEQKHKHLIANDKGESSIVEDNLQKSDSETSSMKATPAMWKCSKIMHMLRTVHPTILSCLDGIVDQIVLFRESWCEEVLKLLKQSLTKSYSVAFEAKGMVSDVPVTTYLTNYIKKLISTFELGVESYVAESVLPSTNFNKTAAASQSLPRRMTVKDPDLYQMKERFISDFNLIIPGNSLLHNLIKKLKKWIKIFESTIKELPRSILMEEKYRYLNNFNLRNCEIELPGEYLSLKHSRYSVKIAKFLPKVDIVQRNNTFCRRFYIRGQNGRVYLYLVTNDSRFINARGEERVVQLLRMFNQYLIKQKETSRRFLQFAIPKIVTISPQMRFIEDNPSSVTLLDIYKQHCAKMKIDHDDAMDKYYNRLAIMQVRGDQANEPVLRDIFQIIQNSLVPKTVLKNWAMQTYTCATDYWTFRKTFTQHLSLMCYSEYVLHLKRVNPEMMYIHRDSGCINIDFFTFNIHSSTGELGTNQPVPFRLTPNITELLTNTCIIGPLTASTIATARCIVQPNFDVTAMLRVILRDEISMDNVPVELKKQYLITTVTGAIDAITSRMYDLASFDGCDNKMNVLVAEATNYDNLCRMDPVWYPWL